MSNDAKKFEAELFKSAQSPIAWLLSAERLRDAAEAILRHEQTKEIPYFKAYANAQLEAIADADGKASGIAEIKAVPPNYPPAQLLYAYAIENVLKGLILINTPGRVQGVRLDKKLRSHDLVELSKEANFTVQVQETQVLKELSELSIWAGRYPVALSERAYVSAGKQNPDEFLNYGSANPCMRNFFEKARKQLESQLPQPIESRFGSLVVYKQPGT